MRHLRFLLIPLLGGALLTGGLSYHAQGTLYSPDQITQMVAPIALYPDALMSQVLMASTYPNQVIETHQWIQANPGLTGGRLDQALATATWDPSVIALCKFPALLDRMARNISWTTDLGNAFLSQQAAVMEAVQTLRSAAYQNGTLRTTEQERVVVQGPDIVIQPSSPEVIYVPAYQPSVVYGSYWNYPSYHYPGVWDPWPGYSFVNGFAWGIGFGIGNMLFGGCDWHHHDVWMDWGVINTCSIYHGTHYYNEGHGGGGYGHQQWEHHSSVGYANGGTGAPYGGRRNGRINGVEPAALRANRGDPASVDHLTARRGQTGADPRDYSRAMRRDTAGSTAREASRTALRDLTTDTPRSGNRPSASDPRNATTRGGIRVPRSDPAYAATRGATRPSAHGPTRTAGPNTARPAQRGQTGTTARDDRRPTVNGFTNYSARGANRTTGSGPANNSARAYHRPPMGGSSSTSSRGANRPTVSGPSGYTRSGNSRSYTRPSAPGGRAGAPSGHSGGGRGASAAPRGGQGGRGHR